MTFLTPVFFWAALGLIPLVAVYFLKVRPRRQPTTAFFLWQTVLDQKRAMSLWQRLRDLLSLLLMVLAFLAVVLALCGPQWSSDQRHDLLIVVDNSVSMSTQHNSDTRLSQAKREAKAMIRSLGPNQQAAVASVSLDMTLRCHFTTSPQSLLEAVDRIQPTVCALRAEAVTSLSNRPLGDRTVRLILISDGCGLEDPLPEGVELFKVSDVKDNIGLVACDMQWVPGSERTASLYFQLASSASEVMSADLWVRGPNDVTQKLIPVEVSPGVNTAEIFVLDQAEPGPWTLSLEAEDALASDDKVCLVLPRKQPIRVGVTAEESYFLQRTVQAFAQTSGDLMLVDSMPDLVLSQGRLADTQRSLLFNPAPGQAGWGVVGDRVDEVVAHEMIEDHPILEHCDLEAHPFTGAREVTLSQPGLVLLQNKDGIPLLFRVQDGERSVVVVNMDLNESNFTYSAWFPVLVYNVSRHLMGIQPAEATSYATGTVLTLSQDHGVTQVTHAMSGEQDQVQGDRFGPLRRLGFYSLENDRRAWTVGTGVYAAAETLVNNEIPDTSDPINRGWAPGIWLSVLALFVLVAECFLYHRRKVG